MTDPTAHALLAVEDGVATLTLNRPEKLNALSEAMIRDAIAALERWSTDREVGCIVLTGAGRGFCAGGDVSAMGSDARADRPFEERVDRQRAIHRLSWLLHDLPKVTIAAVNGPAAGAGLGLALSCDLRIASSAARFTTAFAKVAFGGDFGTTWQLTRLVGEAKAKELLFLADVLDAPEALRLGLVNRVLSHEAFRDEVLQLARRIAKGPLVSLRYMKGNVHAALVEDFRASLDREAVTHLRCGETEDHKEGVAAFLEKREPRFRGR
jgi:2-(1,2-epoxy-1,2-dihydrophenyl)acetyl-CoA isomerase